MTCKASGYSCMQTNDKGECIQRKYIYNCTKSLNENACEALEKLPECEIRKSTCIERDGPKCLAYKKRSSVKATQKSPHPTPTSLIQTLSSVPLNPRTLVFRLKIIRPVRCFERNALKARQKDHQRRTRL